MKGQAPQLEAYTLNVRGVPTSLGKRLAVRAAEERTTVKALVMKALTEYLKSREIDNG